MKFLIYTIILQLIFLYSCGKDVGAEIAEPMLEYSLPSNGAVDVETTTDIIEFNFNVDIISASSSNILVNGESGFSVAASGKVLSVQLPGLSSNTEYSVVIGSNAIRTENGNTNSSSITVSFTTRNVGANITESLAVSDPSAQAINVYGFLKDNYGSKTISSTMANVNWNINEAEWLNYHIGKYPVIAGFDYIHSIESPSNWINYSNTTVVENWWNNNGLVSICWHWRIPVSEGATTYTYKPDESTFVVSNAVVDGTWENSVVKADLEEIAGYLKLLQAKNIPVIWRPLHEAAGNIYNYTGGKAWFWWGAGGHSAYKALWKYMFDYFESQGLNNVIWVWTTQTKDYDFYPGDKYVDIVGRDMYNKTSVTTIKSDFESIQEMFPNKMVALSECGGVSTISSQWDSGVKWSFIMPWYDYTRTNNTSGSEFEGEDHEFANIDWWRNALNSGAVLFRDDIPNLK